jgi:hypothetical protein
MLQLSVLQQAFCIGTWNQNKYKHICAIYWNVSFTPYDNVFAILSLILVQIRICGNYNCTSNRYCSNLFGTETIKSSEWSTRNIQSFYTSFLINQLKNVTVICTATSILHWYLKSKQIQTYTDSISLQTMDGHSNWNYIFVVSFCLSRKKINKFLFGSD